MLRLPRPSEMGNSNLLWRSHCSRITVACASLLLIVPFHGVEFLERDGSGSVVCHQYCELTVRLFFLPRCDSQKTASAQNITHLGRHFYYDLLSSILTTQPPPHHIISSVISRPHSILGELSLAPQTLPRPPTVIIASPIVSESGVRKICEHRGNPGGEVQLPTAPGTKSVVPFLSSCCILLDNIEEYCRLEHTRSLCSEASSRYERRHWSSTVVATPTVAPRS